MESHILDGRRGDITLHSGEVVGLRARDRALGVRYPDFPGDVVFLVLREAGGARRHITDSGWSTDPYWIEAERFQQDGPMLTVGLPARVVSRIPTGTLMKVGVSANGEGFDILGEFEWRLADIFSREATEPVDPATIHAARARSKGPTDNQRVSFAPLTDRSRSSRNSRQPETSPQKPKRSMRVPLLILALLIFLGAAGGGAYYLLLRPDGIASEDTATAGNGGTSGISAGPATAPVPSDAEVATAQLRREIPVRLGNSPADRRASVQFALDSARFTQDESFAIGEAWLADGGGTEAFLIFRSLAAGGYPAAALRLGELQDPRLHDPEISPLASSNPLDAMCWYGIALTSANATNASDIANSALDRRDALVDHLNTLSTDEALDALSVIETPDKCLFQ